MRFQERDGQILAALYKYDGVLARRHLKAMFWPDATREAMVQRLSTLCRHSYINWPSGEQLRTQPIPEPICWLGWRGILWIAGQAGDVKVEAPTRENENQMRLLACRLRKRGVRWLREPRWTQLTHDLAVVDFRLAVEQEIDGLPRFSLEQWIPESVFRANPDVVEYQFKDRTGVPRWRKKGVIPDGYLVIVDEVRRANREPACRIRLLAEIDMATHDNSRFAREKIAAAAAWIKSDAYKARFGCNIGHWLVVTTGEIRMRHLMQQTQKAAGRAARLFFFTTLDQVEAQPPLTSPVWLQVGWDSPRSIITWQEVIPILDKGTVYSEHE